MSQQKIYGLCYRTKLENSTFNYCNFYHLQDPRLKGRLKRYSFKLSVRARLGQGRIQTFS